MIHLFLVNRRFIYKMQNHSILASPFVARRSTSSEHWAQPSCRRSSLTSCDISCLPLTGHLLSLISNVLHCVSEKRAPYCDDNFVKSTGVMVGNVIYCIVANLTDFPWKNVFKSVKIWRNYRHNRVADFLRHDYHLVSLQGSEKALRRPRNPGQAGHLSGQGPLFVWSRVLLRRDDRSRRRRRGVDGWRHHVVGSCPHISSRLA